MQRLQYFRVVVVMALCLMCTGVLHAEFPPRFSNLSVVHGLSQNSVWSILHDKQGFLWFGTDDGLNKYDGYQFQVYRSKIGDTTTLSNNTIRTMIQGKNGLIWLGTSEGLNVYDPATDKFSLVQYRGENAKLERRAVINALAEDAHGNIWAGTRYSGLFRISGDGKVVKQFTNDPNDPLSVSGNAIMSLYVDKAGVLWIGTDGAGVDRYDERSGKFKVYRAGKGGSGGFRDDNIGSFFEDSNGRFWLGTVGSGLALFDRATGTCTYQTKSIPPSDGRLDTLSVLTIGEDQYGHIIYGTYGGGLKFYHPASGITDSWRNNLSDPRSLSSNFILSQYRDETGAIWIGTYSGGISKYDPDGEHFRTFRNEIPHTTRFTDNNIRTIFKDRQGILWIGCGKGLNVFNPLTGTCVQYRSVERDRSTLSDSYVSFIFEDSRGTMWIGTRKGLNTFDRATKRFTRLDDETKYPHAIVALNIRVIIEDRFGVLWIGTPMGIVTYDRRTKEFRTYTHSADDPTSLSSDNVRGLFQDHAGTIWVGTYSGGVNKFDRAKGTFKSYMHNPNNPKSIDHDLTSPIKEDLNGNLWIGTYGGGVNKFNPATETFTAYTENDGLTNNVVFGIEVDKKGILWISTMRGISRLDPATNTIRNYTTAAGLQGEEFNLGSSFRAADGTMYFGGNFGFNEFHPEDIRDNTFLPPVHVTSMTIFNKPAHFDTAMTMKKRIVLPYDENSISFDFVALSYRKSELNQYKYMLEGFDQEWIQSGTTHKASYTNLRPGEYVFKVMGSNNDLLWDTAGASLTIIVEPPFWRTWWAYLLYAAGFVGVTAGSMEYIQRRQRRKLYIEQQKHEAEVVRQKNIKLKEANDEILRQQDILRERNDQIEKTNKELHDQIEQRELLLSELKAALENVKTLGGLIPICSSCKKIRDDEGYWNILETYLIKHSDAQFSHGICPDCAEKLYPQYANKRQGKQGGTV